MSDGYFNSNNKTNIDCCGNNYSVMKSQLNGTTRNLPSLDLNTIFPTSAIAYPQVI